MEPTVLPIIIVWIASAIIYATVYGIDELDGPKFKLIPHGIMFPIMFFIILIYGIECLTGIKIISNK